jgi:hypothetical protein
LKRRNLEASFSSVMLSRAKHLWLSALRQMNLQK